MKTQLLLVVLLITSTGWAQQPLSVKEAQDVALKNNFAIRIAQNNADAARLNNTAGMAGALPQVDLSSRDQEMLTDINQSFSNGTEISRTGNSSNSFSASANASYFLFNGFKIQASKQRLDALQSIGQQELLIQLQLTASQVTAKYFDIVRQQRYQAALLKSQEFAIKKQEIINQRVQVGLSNNADLFQATIDVNDVKQSLAEQELLIRRSTVDLAVLMSLHPDSLFTLTDTIVIDRSIGLDSVLRYLDSHPEMIAAEQRSTVSEQLFREIRSQRLPSIRLDGAYGYSRTANEAGFSLLNQFSGPSVGATLQVPIYYGGSVKTQERIAQLNASSAKTETAMTKQRLEADAIKSYEAYRIALGQLDQQEESFILAGQVMEIQLQRFSLGQSTILDLRAAQSSYEQTAASVVNVRYIAKLAEIELKRLMGTMVF